MSTNCTIGIVLPNDNVKYVYCHWDGYPASHGKGVGYMLINYYNTVEKAAQLIAFGNLSSLDSTIESSKFYIRDFNEQPQDNMAVDTFKDNYLDGALKYPGAEYRYLFTSGQWMCIKSLDTVDKLEKFLAQKRAQLTAWQG
jgi:hypothetical protein